MPDRSRKPPSDPNLAALAIVQQVTGEAPPPSSANPKEAARQAAAMLGRLGGLKGGKARARKLSKKRRAEIARQAARTRWKARR